MPPYPNPNPHQGSHPGVSCDKSGQCPIVGWRFKLTGQNYDLCEAEFNKLPDAEKRRYEKIAAPDSVAPRSEVAVHPGGSHRGLPVSPLGAACPRPSPSIRPHAEAKPRPQPPSHTLMVTLASPLPSCRLIPGVATLYVYS